MRFEKVSLSQFKESFKSDKYYARVSIFPLAEIAAGGGVRYSNNFNALQDYSIEEIYNHISLPRRATKKSAGYDFYAPYDFTLAPGESVKISTGIRVILDDDKFLMCAPRSGHGFKSRVQLDNTIGIIDADYSQSMNEGHIQAKITNDSHTGTYITVKKGEAMMQAIILPYFTVEDEPEITRQRDGGFGSTNK